MAVRGIRGAITVERDTKDAIISATKKLLFAILEANRTLAREDICSVIFTATEDIQTAFPAEAAREIGWDTVPLLCSREIPVVNALPKCIRALIHWNTEIHQSEVQHVYLEGAVKLRPDLN